MAQPVIHVINPPPPWRCGCPACLLRPPWTGLGEAAYDTSEALRQMRETIQRNMQNPRP